MDKLKISRIELLEDNETGRKRILFFNELRTGDPFDPKKYKSIIVVESTHTRGFNFTEFIRAMEMININL